jgi:DNA repair exonuclease SbcCD ATPase subunit
MGQFAQEYRARMKELSGLRAELEDAIARLGERGRQVDRLDGELAERSAWGIRLQEELDEARRNLDHTQAVFEERTRWALQLKSEAEAEAGAAAELRAQLSAVADSRWIKLGNRLGLGPKLKAATPDR